MRGKKDPAIPRRDCPIQIRVTAWEKAQITYAAQAAGMTVTAYILRAAINNQQRGDRGKG